MVDTCPIYFIAMIEILMNARLENPVYLENLKQRLDEMGANSFTASFETYKVTLVKHNCLKANEVECVLKKLGFECSCKDIN